MPARCDLNPGDIPLLLPYLMILDKAGERFRYRLVGTAIVQELGRDFTGAFVGSQVGNPKSAADLKAIYCRVFTAAHPLFATGKFYLASGAIHNMSMLVLPLAGDGTHVNMAVTTLVARFNYGLKASRGWLRGQPLEVCDVTEVGDAEALKRLCLEWDRNSHCWAEP